MKIDKMRLEELKDSTERAARVIYAALKAGTEPVYENLLPAVERMYAEQEAAGTGRHRSPSYIKHKVKNTLKWLTY